MLTRAYTETAARLASDEGATAVEYTIMISLVALVIIFAVTTLGGRLTGLFSTAASAF